MDEPKEADMLATARRSRGQLRRRSQASLQAFQDQVAKVEAKTEFTLDALIGAEQRVGLVQRQLDLYESAVLKCQVLEQFTDEQSAGDEHAGLLEQLQHEFEETQVTLRTLRQLELDSVSSRPVGGEGPTPETSGQGGGYHVPRATVRQPPTLDKDVDYKKYIQWRTSWDNYAQIVCLSDQPDDHQTALFKSFCTPGLLEKMTHAMNIQWSGSTLTSILTQIETYLKEQRNVALDRLRLVNRKQAEGETFDDFYTALCVLADEADLKRMDYDAWLATLVTLVVEVQSHE
eukprot:TCALIF_07998-PA protein Name:"Protein of unknown function" AED:0.45 eAED:0.45 QI:0/0/0/0.5/1/1/2/0/288